MCEAESNSADLANHKTSDLPPSSSINLQLHHQQQSEGDPPLTIVVTQPTTCDLSQGISTHSSFFHPSLHPPPVTTTTNSHSPRDSSGLAPSSLPHFTYPPLPLDHSSPLLTGSSGGFLHPNIPHYIQHQSKRTTTSSSLGGNTTRRSSLLYDNTSTIAPSDYISSTSTILSEPSPSPSFTSIPTGSVIFNNTSSPSHSVLSRFLVFLRNPFVKTKQSPLNINSRTSVSAVRRTSFISIEVAPPLPRIMAKGLLRNPHTKTSAEVCAHFGVNPSSGLSEEQVLRCREQFGLNELTKSEGKSLLQLIIEQFQDLLVRILLVAAFISFFLAAFGDNPEEGGLTAFVEPLVILLILIANAIVGVWQESNAEKSLEALKRLQPELAKVRREGKWSVMNASDLVPGDIVEIRVGDKVPADLRLVKLKTTAFRSEQSSLTGESQSVPKDIEPLDPDFDDCEIQSKTNLLFASTTISNGHAEAVVVATGMSTEIGMIQSAVEAAGEEEESTPLQEKIDAFGEMLSKVIGLICVLVWIINYKNFSDPSHGGVVKGCIYYFKIAVALAVAAIPEGLPAVITTCLALGTRKMAQKNAIVRKLLSVETLGCTTVICSDKTGTLTSNEMCCVRFSVPKDDSSLEIYEVEGHSYTPVGRVISTRTSEEFRNISSNDRALQTFAKIATLCNEARLEVNSDGKYTRQGEPTEVALRVLAEKLGCPSKELNDKYLQEADRDCSSPFSAYWAKNIEKYATLEFSRDRKSMSVLCREADADKNCLFVKGAPESILSRCSSLMLPSGTIVTLTDKCRQHLQEEIEHMASNALRTLALAVRYETGVLEGYQDPTHPSHSLLADPDKFESVEVEMIFVGMVGILDPPRPGVKDAILCCREAGIRVVMITGDNKLTAQAIGQRVGIVSSDCPEAKLRQLSYTGKEFEALSETDRISVLSESGVIFSRTEPKHKQMIIKILRELGEITAMTGDGVNDAPALKQADIGIAMGNSGTEVAKEASDMVLADDNFSTIVSAVEEGRSIYNNMKAFIRYLISSNIGEVASIFLTAALGIPEGLAPVQLLWVNFVTDGPPATALGFNPPDVDVMKKEPRRRDEGLISGWVFFRYMVIGAYVGLATVGIFIWWYLFGIDPQDGHSLISFGQLSNWPKCHTWENFTANTVYDMNPADPCSYFVEGKIKASTLSLTVLVVIELLNSLNALSEEGSLLHMPPWANPFLLLAIAGSISVHLAILYIPFLAKVFGVVPLSLHDWTWVLLWSCPVILIDEVLKAFARRSTFYNSPSATHLQLPKATKVVPKKHQ